MKVIVTGASKGIGRGIATVLAREGFQVGALARSSELLDELRVEIEAANGVCHSAVCDLRDPQATEHAIGTLQRQLGGLDALINNAGLVVRKNAFDLSMEEWHALIDTNIHGLFYATRAVLPGMREQRRGHIINISSISGKMPLPGGSAYAATKFAVTGFSLSLLQEVREYGIKVTVVYPGSVDSPSRHGAADGGVSWKLAPEELGQACADILRTAPGTLISELEIRPLSRPPKP
ncbi:MAG TPA: SDR family NAD(P)-dependent oxidoreductase [Candidatus Hydrogenedentes bacterium]|mgnify:CR=1 FL=1|jgi:NADP-dependent 3-hydroxy acid dehydrogenase YdfG|nr:SDR family NAD(P)-dependent oxidoreductase [Candidatus Hydrogenedentota bacterium]